MADNTTLDPGTGGDVIATDDVAGVKYQRVKLTDGTADSTTAVNIGNGVAANALRVTLASDGTGVVAVTDNGGTLSVDDGAGSLTVDGTVAVSSVGGTVTVDSELTTADLDTGAGTDTRAVVGLVYGHSGGGTLVSDTNPLPISDNGGSLTVDGTVSITANSAVNVAQVAGTTTDTNSGTKSAGTQRVVLATDQPQLTNALKVDGSAVTQPTTDSQTIADDAAFTIATSKVFPVGYLADQTSTDSVNEGDIGAARMTLDRKQIAVLSSSVDTEGYSVIQNLDIDETEDAIKASAGKLHGYYIYNDGAAEVYVKIYDNTVAGVTVGSTTPLMTLGIPAGSAANWSTDVGLPFATAITVAATTGATVADTGAPATNQVVATFYYI